MTYTDSRPYATSRTGTGAYFTVEHMASGRWGAFRHRPMPGAAEEIIVSRTFGTARQARDWADQQIATFARVEKALAR